MQCTGQFYNFFPLLRETNLLVFTDNTSTRAYIHHQGMTKSRDLYHFSVSLLNVCYQYGIRIKAQHIPRRLNVHVDQLSCQRQTMKTEWMLHSSVCLTFFCQCEKPNLDLFTTRFNTHLPLLFITVPGQEGLGSGRIVIKLKRNECIIPFSTHTIDNESSALLSLLVEKPIKLPERHDLEN